MLEILLMKSLASFCLHNKGRSICILLVGEINPKEVGENNSNLVPL